MPTSKTSRKRRTRRAGSKASRKKSGSTAARAARERFKTKIMKAKKIHKSEGIPWKSALKKAFRK